MQRNVEDTLGISAGADGQNGKKGCVVRGPRGCPGPRGPQGPAGPQPPLSDAVDSPAQDVAASSLAVRTVCMGTRRLLRENLTIHVRENGDDARDGLTEATAKASVQGAFDLASEFDPGRHVVVIQVGPGRFAGAAEFVNAHFSAKKLCLRGAGTEATRLLGAITVSTGGLSVSDLSLPSLIAQDQGRIWVRRDVGGKEGDLLFRHEGTSALEVACQAKEGGFIHFQNSSVGFAGAYNNVLSALEEGRICAMSATFTAHEELRAQMFLYAAVWGRISLRESRFDDLGCTVTSAFRIFQGGSITFGSPFVFGNLPGLVHGSAFALLGVSSMAFVTGYCHADGSLGRSAGVLSCQRTALGTYAIEFANNARNARYYGVLALCQESGGQDVRIEVSKRTAVSMVLRAYRNSALTDAAFAFAVY